MLPAQVMEEPVLFYHIRNVMVTKPCWTWSPEQQNCQVTHHCNKEWMVHQPSVKLLSSFFVTVLCNKSLMHNCILYPNFQNCTNHEMGMTWSTFATHLGAITRGFQLFSLSSLEFSKVPYDGLSNQLWNS